MDFEEGDEQVGNFSIFFAEGEALAKQEQYRKAIESFTKVAYSLKNIGKATKSLL